jgi:hypothetical protein
MTQYPDDETVEVVEFVRRRVRVADLPEPDLTPPTPWGPSQKDHVSMPARIVSVGPSHVDAVGPAGQSATHRIAVELETQTLDLFVDERSATLLVMIADYLKPFQSSNVLGTPSFDAAKAVSVPPAYRF